ncbi:MAG TPA: sugar phosphate isomerase/epimerase family protein [Terriglobia bacterium]|jgi:sugar phosphate isomerase/epimerase|nr:sugar phosphate isomerase/epimerase family protein [Terriglobia bacterium]
MDFGISTYMFVDQRLGSHALDRILQAGIRTVELFAARQHLDYHDAHHVRDVAQWFKDHEVSLHSLHAPLFNDHDWGRSGGLAISVAYKEKRLRIDSMDEIKRAIEVAEALPFKYLILHLGVPEEDYDLDKFDASLTSIEHLNLFAKERGVQILLENTPNDLSTPERLLQFIQYTRLDLKICFDTGHAHMTSGVQAAFETLKDRIVSTHIHDNRREKDDHLMPFDGEIDWDQTIRDFRTMERRFPILFELRNYGPEVTSLGRLREVVRKFDAIR